MDDLQTFLIRYERQHPADVWRIGEPVPREYLITAVTLEAERQTRPPVLIFEGVEGSSMPVVTGLFSSRERIAEAVGTTAQQLHQHWDEVSSHLIPPERVAAGVVQEVVHQGEDVDLASLPLLKHFAEDAGFYLTSGVTVARDPDTGVGNLSFARMQCKGPRKFGLSMHSYGHLWNYFKRSEARGQGLPVAVVVGAHPAFLIGAASKVALGLDEYDIVGALLGHPLAVVRGTTVDVPVPADAEIVIEGIIEAGVREPEGPFGEYTGYSTDRSTQNVMTVTAITHRRNPYFLDVCPGHSYDHLYLGRVQKEAEVLRKLRQVLPNVKAIHYPVNGTHYHCYVSIDKQRPGDARHAATLLLGLDAYVKLVVVVDDDIDVTDEDRVMWALATRMQPHEDIFVIEGLNCNVLDPSTQRGVSSKLAIDATRPEGWQAQLCTLPLPARDQARRIAEHRAGAGALGPASAPLVEEIL
jgi:2,5-furandicarboxylate decarboxylase 1